MKRIFQNLNLRRWLVAAVLATLSACGGGGSGDSGNAGAGQAGATRIVQGVAAVGAAVAGTVVLKDATGITAQATTDPTTGKFSIDVTSMTPPFLLRAQNWDGAFLYSASVADGISNVNPLSNVILGTLSTDLGAGTDPDALYQAFATYGASVTTATLDRATTEVYGLLSPAFKAAMGQSDVNPIYTPYAIGNALDQAFDNWQVFYDASSGTFQEYPVAGTTIWPFPLGSSTLVGISHMAGTYAGSAADAVNHLDVPVWAHLDRSGAVLLYTQGSPKTVAFCKLIPGNVFSGSCAGSVYTLDSHGLGTSATLAAISFSVSSSTSAGLAQVTFKNVSSGQSTTLSADVNSTYGNNLAGGAKAFDNSMLGPIQARTDEALLSGQVAFSRNLWFTDSNINLPASATCRTAESYSMQLTDLALSTYTVALHETVTNSSTDATTCTAGGQDFDMVGQGFFTSAGLLTFLVDRADANRTDFVYPQIAVKLFGPA